MRLLSALFCVLAAPVFAHEAWIAPLAYQTEADDRLQAHLVNGEGFEGVNLPYLPRGIVNAVVVTDGEATAIAGRPGDLPALQADATGEGLTIIAYQSGNATLDYDTWEEFQSFVDHKDLGDMRTRHDARGLPADGFTEVYARYAKSLIGVGNSAGADLRVGMETELVALNNPYVDDLTGGFAVQLFYRENPRADAQVEVFAKSPDGTVQTSYLRTDADGVVQLDVQPGHEYMLDAVLLREPSAELATQTGAVWQTMWANLTFAVPQ